MAAMRARRLGSSLWSNSIARPNANINVKITFYQRSLKTASQSQPSPPDFAFAFDIDGVLLRSAKPLPGARKALSYLQTRQIPFILLTNGGGTHEEDRVAHLSELLEVELKTTNFIQSHTPFKQLLHGYESQAPLKDKCVLVIGGAGDNCRQVAEKYGFTNVITSADLITTFPTLWPFASHKTYSSYGKSLGHKTLSSRDGSHGPNVIKVDAILVFNDPRDWALDTQIILDLLMSHRGHLGSVSSKNADLSLPNQGWQQDGQPTLYFSNPDLFWAAAYHLPRMGQGAFREAFKGLWSTVTGGPEKGVELIMQIFGKPHQGTYEFAEKMLQAHRKKLLEESGAVSARGELESVYMIGDNPESDILGANQYRSANGSKWKSILVRSGVYSGGVPAHKPKAIVDGVWDAVRWGLDDAAWQVPEDVGQ